MCRAVVQSSFECRIECDARIGAGAAVSNGTLGRGAPPLAATANRSRRSSCQRDSPDESRLTRGFRPAASSVQPRSEARKRKRVIGRAESGDTHTRFQICVSPRGAPADRYRTIGQGERRQRCLLLCKNVTTRVRRRTRGVTKITAHNKPGCDRSVHSRDGGQALPLSPLSRSNLSLRNPLSLAPISLSLTKLSMPLSQTLAQVGCVKDIAWVSEVKTGKGSVNVSKRREVSRDISKVRGNFRHAKRT